MAFYRAIIAASLHVSKPENRVGMAKAPSAWRVAGRVLSEPQYLNAPEIVLEQVLGGTYADGLGTIKKDARRFDYQPFPHYSAAVWLMTQLRRWNMLKEEIDYKALAEKVMLATDAVRIMREQGASAPVVGFGSEKILGKDFDSNKPQEYLASVRKPG